MRTVFIGTLPPPVTARASGLLAAVVEASEGGAAVEVVSPSPYSVAHRRLTLPAPAFLVEMAAAVRGADRLVLQIEPGFPLRPGLGRARRAATLAGMALLLRSSRAEVVVRLDSIADLDEGLSKFRARAFWRAASEIQVADEETRQRLAATVGASVSKISIRTPAGGAPLVGAEVLDVAEVEGWPGDAVAVHADTAGELVRGRAVLERRRLAAAGGAPLSSLPLSAWLPAPGAGVPHWASPATAPAPASSPARRAAGALLRACERHEATRPLAQAVRLARQARLDRRDQR